MFSFEIEYINGISFAAKPTNPEVTEWPPHPDRLFSALVSSWGINEKNEDILALEWLESQDPPDIFFPDIHERPTFKNFVPISSNQEKIGGIFHKDSETNNIKPIFDIIGSIKSKPRYFPAAILPNNSQKIYFVWSHINPPQEFFDSLKRLANQIAYMGHSTSFVRATVKNTACLLDNTYTYDKNGVKFLRCPYKGRFSELKLGFKNQFDGIEKSIEKNSLLWHPPISSTQKYTDHKSIIVKSKMNYDWTVLALKQDLVPMIESFPILAKKMRDTIMSLIDEPIHEIISGHAKDGKPLKKPHLAIVPMAYVGWQYSDGTLKGIGLILPRNSTYGTPERRQLKQAIKKFLHKGGNLIINKTTCVKLEEPSNMLSSLQNDRYINASKKWSSVTPIVLDRHPKKNRGETLGSIIAESCIKFGFPKPVKIETSRYSSVPESPPAYPSKKENTKGWKSYKGDLLNRKPICHAIITFDTEISGPLLIGAGRYYGLGLFINYKGDDT